MLDLNIVTCPLYNSGMTEIHSAFIWTKGSNSASVFSDYC